MFSTIRQRKSSMLCSWPTGERGWCFVVFFFGYLLYGPSTSLWNMSIGDSKITINLKS